MSGIQTPAYLVKIARRGLTRFISHLDWIVLFQQAMFRSRLPVVLTEGYNKKLKSKYSPPLPTGVASECEFAEIWLHEELTESEVFAKLHDKFATDFALRAVIRLPHPAPKNPWKEVVAARYRLDLLEAESSETRASMIRYLEECLHGDAKKLKPLAERRAARKARGGATFSGDEDLMGGGGGGAIVPAARILFEEAGDPRDMDRANRVVDHEQDDQRDPMEHHGRIHALDGLEAFGRGESDQVWLTGPLAPNMTLHPMRLSLCIAEVARMQAPPVMTKEMLLDRAGEEVFPG